MSVDPMEAEVKLAELAMDLASDVRIFDEESREELANLAAVVLWLKWEGR